MESHTRVRVYVRLLEEGPPVSRPTQAIQLTDTLYKLLPSPGYDPADEKWEFLPGTIVRVEKHHGSAGEYLLAVAQ